MDAGSLAAQVDVACLVDPAAPVDAAAATGEDQGEAPDRDAGARRDSPDRAPADRCFRPAAPEGLVAVAVAAASGVDIGS